MIFYTKCSVYLANDQHKYRCIKKLTLLLLFVGILQAKAKASETKYNPISGQSTSLQDSALYQGRITNHKGEAMPGVTVKIVGTSRLTLTNSAGEFSIIAAPKESLDISYLGYHQQYVTLSNSDTVNRITVRLTPGENLLGDINIVSNGFDDRQRMGTVGSYEVISKEQLMHSADPNLIKRLEGITTSVDFNNQSMRMNSANAGNATLNGQFNNSPLARLSIRGKNSFSPRNTTADNNGLILVVIDGVPGPYSIDNVNPNDVESITILKDASAAAIWGSRAANGVIVVKTKRGGYEKPLSINFNSSLITAEKIDQFYNKTMSTAEFVDAQVYQFDAANTIIGDPNATQPQFFYSPVAELLNQQKQGQITLDQANAQLSSLKGNDLRRDYDKYLFRKAFTQSYHLALDGGEKKMAYRLSANYDDTKNNTFLSGSKRMTVTYGTNIKPVKNLELSALINFSQRTSNDQAPNELLSGSFGGSFFPYTKLADNQGTPLVIPHKYRPAFVDLMNSTYGSNIRDLSYVPLEDIHEGYARTMARSINFNFGAIYKFNPVLSAYLNYNYNRGRSEEKILDSQKSFYMRDLITQYTAPDDYVDPFLGSQPFFKHIPEGGLYNQTINLSTNQYLRGGITAIKTWTEKHQIHAMAGLDATEGSLLTQSDQFYGYDEKKLRTAYQMNYSGFITPLFNNINGDSLLKIPYYSGIGHYKSRNYSLFTNADYTFDQLYTISASIRKDIYSELGDKNNKGTIPFYSIGGRWDIGGENFFKSRFLSLLQLRASYGTLGTVSSIITDLQSVSLPINEVRNTNYLTQPDRTHMLNVGIDFGFTDSRIIGSVEYYRKNTNDRIWGSATDIGTGNPVYTIISQGKLKAEGMELRLYSQNIKKGLFSWNSTLLMAFNRTKVDSAPIPLSTSSLTNSFEQSSLLPNAYLNQISAFRWAGLDPGTGAPRGLVDGVPIVVNDIVSYAKVSNQTSSLKSFGSALPVHFGSFRNTFQYGPFSLSANILYKLGYYFRRPVYNLVQYDDLFNNGVIQGAEFSQRWQKPGDETFTNVPSMSYPSNNQRDQFYKYSEINVQKADHLRLQELNIAYSFTKKDWFLKKVRLYANISNLGIIWRANKLGLDPDTYDYPIPRTYSFGVNANF